MRQQHRRQPQREQQHQQVFHRNARAGQQRQADHGDGDQAGGVEEVQAQADRRHQVGIKAGRVTEHRQHAKRDQQAFVRLGAGGQAGALIEGRSGIKASGGERGKQAG
ncbi:hypothetical protein D3C71_1938440 [compost metagenome]